MKFWDSHVRILVILLIQNHIRCIVDKEYALFTWSSFAFAWANMCGVNAVYSSQQYCWSTLVINCSQKLRAPSNSLSPAWASSGQKSLYILIFFYSFMKSVIYLGKNTCDYWYIGNAKSTYVIDKWAYDYIEDIVVRDDIIFFLAAILCLSTLLYVFLPFFLRHIRPECPF